MKMKKDKIEIRDIFKATFLWLKTGFRPTLTKNGDMIFFLFPDTEETEKTLHDFFDNISAPIKDYITMYQILRAEMYMVKGSVKNHE